MREIETRFGKLIGLIPAAVYTCDAEGRLTFFNDEAARIWGRKPELGDEHGRFCGAFRLWLPDGSPLRHEECPMADAVRHGRAARNLEVVVEQPTGVRLVANVNIDPLYDAEGLLAGAVNVFTDVTERKQAEARLQEREAALARVQRIGAVGGLDIDVAGGMRSWRSPEYLRLHGLPSGTREETHTQWLERVHPDDRQQAERTLFAALDGGAMVYESEYRIIRSSDQAVRWIHARADIERSPEGKPIRLLGAHVDITEQKDMQEALRGSQERQAFLLKLSDALRPVADPLEVQRVAMRCLGEQLRADRALYYRAEPSEHGFVHIVDSEYFSRPGVVSVTDTPRANKDYGAGIFAGLEKGDTVAIPDLWADPHVGAPERERYTAISLRAFIAVPVIKDGRYVGGVSVQAMEPRQWTATEVELVEEVTERIWAAVERARAQVALRESEASLRRNGIWLDAQKEAFRVAMNGGSLEASLGVLTRAVTGQMGGAQNCAFYIADNKRRHLTQVVGMPPSYAVAVNGVEISPESLSCGLAATTGRPVIISDVLEDPRWQPWTRLAREHDYRGCWAFPVETAAGRLVGSLAIYFQQPRDARSQDLELAAMIARTAAIIISRHEENEERIRSEERLRKFGEASQDILWIRDAATLQWQYLTPAFEPIYGLAREEALSGDNYRNWLDLVLPEDRGRVERAIGKVREGEHVTFDYRIRRPADGTVRWLRNTDFPIEGRDGEVKLIGGVGHDLTRFQETKLRLQSLMEGIPQLVWRAVDSGQWTWSSPQWTAYTGVTAQESTGFGWLEAVHPDDREAAMRFWEEAARSGRLEMEGRIRHAATDEYHWFQTRAAPVRDEGGAIVEWLGTSTDIHDLRTLQERQKVLVAELQHRTRNLLGVVRSMAEKTVRASAGLSDFRLRFRDRLDALSRVQSLLSRLDEHDRVTFDELLSAEFSAMDANDRVTLSGPADVRLRSSTVQTLALALHELATNAVKYGALGQSAGKLAVTWRLEPEGDGGKPWLHIDWHESGVEMPPSGATPRGTGQGRELIEHALPYQLSARTSYVMGPDGVHCTISMPVSADAAF